MNPEKSPASAAANIAEKARLALSVDEAARRLGVGRQTIYNWLAAGKLSSVKIVGRRLIPVSAIRALLGEAA